MKHIKDFKINENDDWIEEVVAIERSIEGGRPFEDLEDLISRTVSYAQNSKLSSNAITEAAMNLLQNQWQTFFESV